MNGQNEGAGVLRNYKDSLFRMLFSDKKELLALYNALNGSDYTDESLLEIKTLENAIYMNIKDDLSFLINDNLCIYEHQSSYNPNMPLRDLFYVADQLQREVKDKDLYSSKLVKIPVPEFIVFYNGMDEKEDLATLRLSDAFEKKEESPRLELIVTMLNINEGHNKELMEKCDSLRGYAVYVGKVRKYVEEKMPLEDAVEKAVQECIEDDVLREFLLRQKSEVIKMSIYEFDQEKHNLTLLEEGYERGRDEGMALGLTRVVLNMHEYNFTLEQIANATKKTVDEVQEIINQANTSTL